MDKRQKQQLKSLLQDEKFDSLLAYYQVYLDNIRKENVIGKDNGETLKLTLMREGKIMSIKEFFDNLEKEVFNEN